MKKSALYYLFVTIAGLTAGLLPINIFAAPGDLFESDQGSNTIFKFTPAGAKSTFATGLGGPFGLAVDGFGNVFEANFNNGMIFKFTPASAKSIFASGLTQPSGLAFEPPSVAYDFNQDRKPDYVLFNAVTQQTGVWYLNNNVFIGGAFGPTLPANWKVVGVADFDGDGRSDYLLFNSTTHQTAIWYLSGTILVSGTFGPSLLNSWDLVAVGDFNADGKPDYVLYNAVTYQTAF